MVARLQFRNLNGLAKAGWSSVRLATHACERPLLPPGFQRSRLSYAQDATLEHSVVTRLSLDELQVRCGLLARALHRNERRDKTVQCPWPFCAFANGYAERT
eukprot:6190609-Pleurochrysis_carterae.AAC.2